MNKLRETLSPLMDAMPSSQEILSRLSGDATPPAEASSAPASAPASLNGGAQFPPPAAPPPPVAAERLPPPLRPELEAALREVADVDRAVRTGRMPWLKKALTILCRPFLRRQAAFNERTVASLRELGGQLHSTTARAGRLEHWVGGGEARVGQLEGWLQGREGKIAQLEKWLQTETQNRERLERWMAAEVQKREQTERWMAAEVQKREQTERWMAAEVQKREQTERWMAAEVQKREQTERWMAAEVEKREKLERWLVSEVQEREKLEKSLEEARAWENLARVHELAQAQGQMGSAQGAQEARLGELRGRQERLEDHLRTTQRETGESLQEFRASVENEVQTTARRLEESRQADRIAVWERIQSLENAHRQAEEARREMKASAEDAFKADRAALWERLQRLEAFLKGAQDLAGESVRRLEDTFQADRSALWERLKRFEDALQGAGRLNDEIVERFEVARQRLEEAAQAAHQLNNEIVQRFEASRQRLQETAETDRAALWERLARMEESARSSHAAAAEAARRMEELLQAERAALWGRLQTLEEELRQAQARARELATLSDRDDLRDRLGKLEKLLIAAREEMAPLRSKMEEQIAAARAILESAAAERFALPAPASKREAPEQSRPAPAAFRLAPEDCDYFQFELQFRGDSRDLEQRQARYVKLLRNRLGAESLEGRAILDLGCGSGVFVDLLNRREKARARGVDINGVSVAAGREMGRAVEQGDLFEVLRAVEPGSLDAIAAFQVVEHLPAPALRQLAQACFAALRPGGVVVWETINPGSLSAFRWFFMDLTHQRFLFPEVLEHLLARAGFADCEREFLSEPPAWEKLETPVFRENLDDKFDGALRRNFAKLNRWLYGPMEYCVSARRPLAAAAPQTLTANAEALPAAIEPSPAE